MKPVCVSISIVPRYVGSEDTYEDLKLADISDFDAVLQSSEDTYEDLKLGIQQFGVYRGFVQKIPMRI